MVVTRKHFTKVRVVVKTVVAATKCDQPKPVVGGGTDTAIYEAVGKSNKCKDE